jgi:hypothetical protein
LFGGAGVANATAPSAPPPSSTTTAVAQGGDATTNNNNHSDKTGLWGLLGLAGLAGLAGLTRRRHEANVGTSTAVRGTRGETPRA